jgi:transposase
MVRRKSAQASELDFRIAEAIKDIKSGKYKSPYEAAKVLGLNRDTLTRRVKGGLSRTQARHAQQKLSYDQENVLLKWIKQLTVSGYSPGHQLLKEVAEEIRSERDYTLRDTISTSPNTSFYIRNHLLLGQDWVPRFVQRHPYLKVVIGRRIESVRMDGATKPAIDAWFVAYKDLIQILNIKPQNTYSMDESGFTIGTMDSTRIIIDSTLRTKYQAHPGRQE